MPAPGARTNGSSQEEARNLGRRLGRGGRRRRPPNGRIFPDQAKRRAATLTLSPVDAFFGAGHGVRRLNARPAGLRCREAQHRRRWRRKTSSFAATQLRATVFEQVKSSTRLRSQNIRPAACGTSGVLEIEGMTDGRPMGLSFGAGGGRAGRDANLLGGKGANLAEMSARSCRLPPGFTITTEVCTPTTPTAAILRPRLEGPGRGRRSRRHREEVVGMKFGDPPTRCWSRCAPAPVDAGHDGHRAEPRPQRPDRPMAWRSGRRPLRL